MLYQQHKSADTSIASLGGEVEGFADQINEILIGMKEFNLPDKVVPTAEVTAALLDFVIEVVGNRLPGKLKLIKKIVIDGAGELTGARQWILEEIGKLVEDSSVDPNNYWRDTIIPEFGADIRNAIRTIGSQFETFFAKAPVVGMFAVKLPKLPEATIESAGTVDENIAAANAELEGEFNEDEGGKSKAQPTDPCPNHAKKQQDKETAEESSRALNDSTEKTTSGASASPKTSRGEPLSHQQNWTFGQQFGHDFSHVRVHQDTTAARLNRQNNSRALTSGSHIFLSPSVQTTSPEGRGVILHELSHVLQKTGPRPLGTGHANRPQSGRPNKGLRVNPHEEFAANHMAAKFASTSSRPQPLTHISGRTTR